MWKSTLISIMFLISPFLTCDPDPDATSYIITDNGRFVKQVKAQPDGSLKYSVRKARIGFHRMTIMACNEYWCDGVATLEFVRPSKPKKITKFELRPVLDTDKFQFIDTSGTEGYRFLDPPPRKKK